MSLVATLKFPIDLKKVQRRLSNLRKCRVALSGSRPLVVYRPMTVCRFIVSFHHILLVCKDYWKTACMLPKLCRFVVSFQYTSQLVYMWA